MRKRGGIRHTAHREAISLDGCGNGSDLSELLHIQFEKERKICSFFWFARHGRALTGESPEHAQIVGSV